MDFVRNIYVRYLRPRIKPGISRQRFKLLWHVWGYVPLVLLPSLSMKEKLFFLRRFLTIDWFVEHAHKPSEILTLFQALISRPARPGEVVVEAGCWKGGSSAKFSLLCRRFGYKLHIFDSFEGVEPGHAEPGAYDFSFEYKAGKEEVEYNLQKFGDLSVCVLHKGWFKDSFREPFKLPVRLVYIDCDLASGTQEVLRGCLPELSPDGVVFTQDFHIKAIRSMLEDPETWKDSPRGKPEIQYRTGHLAELWFKQ